MIKVIKIVLMYAALLAWSGGGQAIAAEIRVAAASNFNIAMNSIARAFENETEHKVLLSFGSTGKHYAQIRNGAPFDVYFAADTRRPKLLEIEGRAIAGSRFTYAVGKVVLWSPQAGYVDQAGKILEHGDFRHLAVANPKLAPYGEAAREILQALGLWDKLKPRLVRGENIGQAFQFVVSGNAKLGFVARSQLLRPGQAAGGSYWDVPQSLYTPIQQQAVLLRDSDPARAFISFMRSEAAIKIIQEHGYERP